MPNDCSPGIAESMANSQVANQKILQDSTMSRENQAILDNQEDSRAWSQLKLRIATNAATVDHLANVFALQATATAQQTGQTEDEQTVSPIRTGAGDAIAAVPGVAAGMVSMSGGDLAQLVAQTVAAVVPLVVNASAAKS